MNRTITALAQDLAEMRLPGDRGRQSLATAAAVVLATAVALAVRVDAAWWAAISAFVLSHASLPFSLRRGALRIVGTAIGAALGLILSPWLVEDRVALSLVIFTGSTVGVIGFMVSRYGYSWLLGAVTIDMVLLGTVDDPFSAFSIACNRMAEVAIGTLAAILVGFIAARRTEEEPPPAVPGWSDLFGAEWPVTRHAIRAGIAVMMVPWVWSWLDLPSLSQTAVTATAVMAVPSLSNDAAVAQQKIAERGFHRLLGCLIWGIAGLACLALSVANFLPWLAMLAVGIWVAAYVQGSMRGVGYVGTQGAVVYICTLVQGWGPPTSILPGIERFAGITGGLLILLAVTFLTSSSQAANMSADRREAAI